MIRKAKSEERLLWLEAMRGVRRLGAAPMARESETAAPAAPPRNNPHTDPTAPLPRRDIDRRSAQRVKRGQTTIEARLDLHGMTQAEAHRALAAFLARAQQAGHRLVLVITGKSGVLHGAVPRWLEEGENRGRVLAFGRAQPLHGGAGALYVFLRRKR